MFFSLCSTESYLYRPFCWLPSFPDAFANKPVASLLYTFLLLLPSGLTKRTSWECGTRSGFQEIYSRFWNPKACCGFHVSTSEHFSVTRSRFTSLCPISLTYISVLFFCRLICLSSCLFSSRSLITCSTHFFYLDMHAAYPANNLRYFITKKYLVRCKLWSSSLLEWNFI